MNFANAANHEAQIKLTENGAVAYDRLNSSLLSLFGTIGSLRPRSEQEIENKFATAFNEDNLLAIKLMFYAGNIRGGLGERRTFRVILKNMAYSFPSIIKKNLACIPLFNRWDSLFELVGTPVENDMWSFIKEQFISDLHGMKEGKSISLLGKWMPSINTSSERTRKLARIAMNKFGIRSEKTYRKALTELRKYLEVVEHQMSAQDWGAIKYPNVPSYAMAHYGKAFGRHDYERFNKYIESLNKGETKVNASTLYPYDLTKNYMGYHTDSNILAEQQWKALPNYISGDNNIIVMADVSGSMSGRPMETSVGLAIYFAEHNKGAYEGLYMTFTDHPHFVKLEKGASLRTKCAQVMRTDVGYGTNLEAAFAYLLKTAIVNHVSSEEMPKAIVVISDMEIDRYMRPDYGYETMNWDFISSMEHKFHQYGYELPKMVLWNVEARQDTFLSQSDKVIFVSGQSTSTFKTLLTSLEGTSMDVMLNTLNDPMYDVVKI